MPGARRTWIGALLGLAAALALLAIVLASSGDSGKSGSEEADAAYLEVAHRTRELTFTIDRATADPPVRLAIFARQFRGFHEKVGYTATFLLTLRGIGPVADRGFVLHHSLGIYEFVLGDVARQARLHERSSERLLAEVRKVGVEVRAANTAWERALETALAD